MIIQLFILYKLILLKLFFKRIELTDDNVKYLRLFVFKLQQNKKLFLCIFKIVDFL